MLIRDRRRPRATGVRGDDDGVSVEDLGCRFGARVLYEGVTFSVRRGESMAITGETGSGKSTLLALLSGMMRLRQGEARIEGLALRSASAAQLARMRLSAVGIVHQHGELVPTLTAVENVMVPMLLARQRSWDEARRRAVALCERFGVESLTIPAESLSGGERQRVALARALANEPAVLLADEPTASLDTSTRDLVAQEIFGLAHSGECAVLVVTHDPAVASWAGTTAHLADGGVRVMRGNA